MEILAVTSRIRAASSEVFGAAAVELCARLWSELERLCATLETDDADVLHPCLATRMEVLRLELTIIRERCANRWTAQLDQRQRQWLETIMEDVLDALDACGDELPDHQSLASAQNRLLIAVLEQCAESSYGLIQIPVYRSDFSRHARSNPVPAGVCVYP
jgi:hypothetical protein